MNEQEIQTLLHHRRPYLMVDKVHSLTPNQIIAEKNHHGDEAHVSGHFPGAPVVPGAMLQEICTQSAGILLTKFYSPVENYDSEKTKGHAIGVLKKVDFAKFKSITKPNKPIRSEVTLTDQVENMFKFKAKVYQDDKVMASFGFTLVNVSDEYLY